MKKEKKVLTVHIELLKINWQSEVAREAIRKRLEFLGFVLRFKEIEVHVSTGIRYEEAKCYWDARWVPPSPERTVSHEE